MTNPSVFRLSVLFYTLFLYLQGEGFNRHVRLEHNLWAYLFFFIHLDETRPNNYSALEFYVYKLVSNNAINFRFTLRKQNVKCVYASFYNHIFIESFSTCCLVWKKSPRCDATYVNTTDKHWVLLSYYTV